MTDTTDILNAIGALKSHIDQRFEAMEQRLDAMDQRFDTMERRFDRMQESMMVQGERISRMEGRLDEQSRILAALIPTRIAAVPPAAE